jgi:hypothetical protein
MNIVSVDVIPALDSHLHLLSTVLVNPYHYSSWTILILL